MNGPAKFAVTSLMLTMLVGCGAAPSMEPIDSSGESDGAATTAPSGGAEPHYFDYSGPSTADGYDANHNCDIDAVGAIVFASIGISVPRYVSATAGVTTVATCMYFPKEVIDDPGRFPEYLMVTTIPGSYDEMTLDQHVGASADLADLVWSKVAVDGLGQGAWYIESRMGDNPTYAGTPVADLTTGQLSAAYPDGIYDVGFALLSEEYPHPTLDALSELMRIVAE